MSASLHIDTAGPEDGPTVVFHHGFAGSARNWRPQVRALRERAHCVAYDARGHARSAELFQPSRYALDDFVRDFGDVARARNSSGAPFVAVGLSLGAAVALHFALREPGRLRGLVLAASPGGTEAEGGFSPNALAFAECLEADGMEAAGMRFVWGPSSGIDPQAAKLVRQGFMEHPPRALAEVLRQTLAALASPDRLRDELAVLDIPTVVIVGSKDRNSLEPSRVLAESLPNATLVQIEGAGHVVNLSAQAEFNDVLLSFLDTLDASET